MSSAEEARSPFVPFVPDEPDDQRRAVFVPTLKGSGDEHAEPTDGDTGLQGDGTSAGRSAETMRISYRNIDGPVRTRRSTAAGRPYPGVVRRGNSWEARYSNNGKSISQGTYSTPELARIAVLNAQAEYLERKAERYRREAAILGDQNGRR